MHLALKAFICILLIAVVVAVAVGIITATTYQSTFPVPAKGSQGSTSEKGKRARSQAGQSSTVPQGVDYQKQDVSGDEGPTDSGDARVARSKETQSTDEKQEASEEGGPATSDNTHETNDITTHINGDTASIQNESADFARGHALEGSECALAVDGKDKEQRCTPPFLCLPEKPDSRVGRCRHPALLPTLHKVCDPAKAAGCDEGLRCSNSSLTCERPLLAGEKCDPSDPAMCLSASCSLARPEGLTDAQNSTSDAPQEAGSERAATDDTEGDDKDNYVCQSAVTCGQHCDSNLRLCSESCNVCGEDGFCHSSQAEQNQMESMSPALQPGEDFDNATSAGDASSSTARRESRDDEGLPVIEGPDGRAEEEKRFSSAAEEAAEEVEPEAPTHNVIESCGVEGCGEFDSRGRHDGFHEAVDTHENRHEEKVSSVQTSLYSDNEKREDGESDREQSTNEEKREDGESDREQSTNEEKWEDGVSDREQSTNEEKREDGESDREQSTNEEKWEDGVSDREQSTNEEKREDGESDREQSTNEEKREDGESDREQSTNEEKWEDGVSDREQSTNEEKREDGVSDREQSTNEEKREDGESDREQSAASGSSETRAATSSDHLTAEVRRTFQRQSLSGSLGNVEAAKDPGDTPMKTQPPSNGGAVEIQPLRASDDDAYPASTRDPATPTPPTTTNKKTEFQALFPGTKATVLTLVNGYQHRHPENTQTPEKTPATPKSIVLHVVTDVSGKNRQALQQAALTGFERRISQSERPQLNSVHVDQRPLQQEGTDTTIFARNQQYHAQQPLPQSDTRLQTHRQRASDEGHLRLQPDSVVFRHQQEAAQRASQPEMHSLAFHSSQEKTPQSETPQYLKGGLLQMQSNYGVPHRSNIKQQRAPVGYRWLQPHTRQSHEPRNQRPRLGGPDIVEALHQASEQTMRAFLRLLHRIPAVKQTAEAA